MNTTILHLSLLLGLGVAASSCAATKALHTETSTAAIRSAEEVGATGVPQAALHLQLAREELQAAMDLNANKQPEEAKSMLLRAEADAELAIALSAADHERVEAEAAMTRVHELQIGNPYAPGGAE